MFSKSKLKEIFKYLLSTKLIIVIISIIIYQLSLNDCKATKVELPDSTKKISELEQILKSKGLVNIQDVDPSIHIDIKYSTPNNFLGIDIYEDYNKAYLPKEVAYKLKNAQKLLHDTLPNYNLVVFDATRPQSIQQIMWDSIKIPNEKKYQFLADPKKGSLHNYGAAVDLSILDEKGKELDMGTTFDSFEKLSYPLLEKDFLAKRQLTQQQVNNRLLLRKIMNKSGFFGIKTEWWHFGCYSVADAKKKLILIADHKIRKEEAIISKNNSTSNIPKNPLTNEITFKIQLKTTPYLIDINSREFKGLKVEKYLHEGNYKYTSGNFKNIQEARIYKLKIINLGFNDAFIAAFENGKRIPIEYVLKP